MFAMDQTLFEITGSQQGAKRSACFQGVSALVGGAQATGTN